MCFVIGFHIISSGLAGYFEAVLYGNIGLSIHPHRKDRVSKDMLSWFPLFFPFKVRGSVCLLAGYRIVIF
jgi:protein arginine N-methyltransferase 5